MGPRIRGLPLRRDHLLHPDAPSPRQASRSVVGRHCVVSPENVRARPRTARLTVSSPYQSTAFRVWVSGRLCGGIASCPLRLEPGGGEMDGAAKRQPEILTPE